MTARLHPGNPILSMDHSVITLHEGGRPDGAQTGFLSMYDIAFHHQHGAGRVALIDIPAAGVSAVFTDRRELGEAWIARLVGMGHAEPMFSRPPVVVHRFERDPWVDDSFGYRFEAPGIDFAARWFDLDTPFFAEGGGGGLSDTEDIWSLFVGARSAALAINGIVAPGAPYDDDAWLPKLGRTVSSAHSALGETRITPVR
jgi:hypothetical protein